MLSGRSSDYIKNPPIECVVFGWGANEDGQLGFDHDAYVMTPRIVEALLGSRLRGRTSNSSALVSGSRNSLVLTKDGEVWTWGWNERGTLGRGDRSVDKRPRKIKELKGHNIVQASIGGWHCLALDDKGEVYAWGGNEYLQCGIDIKQRDIVSPIKCFSDKKVKQVACGGMHSLALTDDDEVWTWGEPWGDFSLSQEKTPRKVEGAANIAQIACGAFHNMALTRGGQDVLCWGINDYGQLGIGSTTYKMTPTKVIDLEGIEIISISAGGWHSMALSSTGEVYTWGRGEYGRLGINDATGSSRLKPILISGLYGYRIVQACAGGTHSLCLTDEGKMLIWGRGSFGRLGTGMLKNSIKPIEIILPGGSLQWKVIAISCGGRHSLCLALPHHAESSSQSAQLKLKLTDGNEGDDENSEYERKSSFYDVNANHSLTLNLMRSNDCNFESLNKNISDIVLEEEDAENDTENETWEREISYDVNIDIDSEPSI